MRTHRRHFLHGRDAVMKLERTPRSFGTRHLEHWKGSLLTTSVSRESNFHNTYPQKAATYPSARQGYFDDLELYCGLGFDRHDKHHSLLYDNTVDHPVFAWSDKTVSMLKTSKVGTSAVPLSLEGKQLIAVSYLTEVVYDICIPDDNNVSGSPGYESMGMVNGG